MVSRRVAQIVNLPSHMRKLVGRHPACQKPFDFRSNTQAGSLRHYFDFNSSTVMEHGGKVQVKLLPRPLTF